MSGKELVFAAMPGGWEMVVIALVILLLFGAKKLPELVGGSADLSGSNELKDAQDAMESEGNTEDKETS